MGKKQKISDGIQFVQDPPMKRSDPWKPPKGIAAAKTLTPREILYWWDKLKDWEPIVCLREDFPEGHSSNSLCAQEAGSHIITCDACLDLISRAFQRALITIVQQRASIEALRGMIIPEKGELDPKFVKLYEEDNPKPTHVNLEAVARRTGEFWDAINAPQAVQEDPTNPDAPYGTPAEKESE